MLYVFGDSMSYGWGFVEQGMSPEEARLKSWPYLLSQRMNTELKDDTVPGGSSWRIARKIQECPLTKDDVVIIQWSSPFRLEIGVNNDFQYQGPKEESRFNNIDRLEDDGRFRTKTICPSLINKTSDPTCRFLMEFMFENFYNMDWYGEMFKVLMTSTLYKLNNVGCKYMMFDGWTPSCHTHDFADIEQYVFRGRTLANIMRDYPGNYLPDKTHLSENEELFCAELIEKKFNELYQSYNEPESVYTPELLNKYSLPIPRKTVYSGKKGSPFYSN